MDTGHDLLVIAAAEDWISLWMLDRTTTDTKIRTATEEFNPAGTGVNKSGAGSTSSSLTSLTSPRFHWKEETLTVSA